MSSKAGGVMIRRLFSDRLFERIQKAGARSYVFFFFALALGIRLVFLAQWVDLPYAQAPLLDAAAYDAWAKAIAQGELFRTRAFYQSPLYPYLCGAAYALFGAGPWVSGLLNALLGAGCVAALAGMTFLLFGSVAAASAGMMAAFYRPFIFNGVPLMKEPLALLLTVVVVFFTYRALKKNLFRDYGLAGFLFGLCALVRGNMLLFVPVIIIAAIMRFGKKGAGRAAVLMLALLLAILPATLHNYIVSGDFVLVNYTDGFNLYIGNSPYANGTNQYPPEVSTDPVQEEMNTIWVAQQALGHAASPSEVSAYWRSQAMDYSLKHPSRVIELVGRKLLAFWNAHESFDNYDPSFIEDTFGTILKVPLFTFWCVTFLAALGVVCGFSLYPKRVAFLLVWTFGYMATLCVFYVTDRYRLPALVFLLPLAGLGVSSVLSVLQKRNIKLVTAALVSGAVMLWLGLRPDPSAVDLRAYNWGTLAMIYEDAGQDAQALRSFHKALEISPSGAGHAAYVRASYAYENLGMDSEAEKVLLRGVTIYPDNGIVLYNYGRFLAARSRMKEGMAAFEKAKSLSPYYLLNYYALAKGYAVLGEVEKALVAAHQGLMLDPRDRLLKNVLDEIQRTAP